MHPTIEIPQFLSHLRVYRGFPTPFIVAIDPDTDVPDFRVNDVAKVVRCASESLCAICGHVLGEFCWFSGGPTSIKDRLFVDPMMHEACARFAMKVCPFLNGNRKEYSQREVTLAKHDVVTNFEMQGADKQYLLKTRSKYVKLARHSAHPGLLFLATREWMAVEEFNR